MTYVYKKNTYKRFTNNTKMDAQFAQTVKI